MLKRLSTGGSERRPSRLAGEQPSPNVATAPPRVAPPRLPEKAFDGYSPKLPHPGDPPAPSSPLASGNARATPGMDPGPFEDALLRALGPKATAQNGGDVVALPGTVPSTAELREFFKKVVADKSVPWEYLPDGCYSKAHVTCAKLLAAGYNCAKLYLMQDDPDLDSDNYPFPGRFHASNKFTDGSWWYHVAALVFARDEATGAVDGYILDPAMNKARPLSPAEWVKTVWNGQDPIRFDTTYADTYDPPSVDPLSLPTEFSRERFDKFLAQARKTNEDYAHVLARIKAKYYEKHPDEKPEEEG